ncbi:MAG: MAPEG family protein [Micropepsaceae bacterium]
MLITHMQVFALYAALNGLIVLLLALNVTRVRMSTKVMIGDGGDQRLLRAFRAHANAVEYVPLILVLLGALAGMKASMLMIHIVGGLLTFGRILHAIGLTRSSGVSIGRGAGTLLTWIAFIVAIAGCFLYALKA